MNKLMVINSSQFEEVRIAIISENGDLLEFETESTGTTKLKGNVYKAKILRLEPSLQAAFVDIGSNRNGFLQITDIHPSYFPPEIDSKSRNVNIADILKQGQNIVVQVLKEERDLKGATLTTHISLPGRYTVLIPGNDKSGVSRRINHVEQRRRLKLIANELEIPAGVGIIIRTAGLDRSLSDLSRDISIQLKVWQTIIDAQHKSADSPRLLYREGNLASRVIRDYFTPDVREILIDDEQTYEEVKSFVGQVMPRYRSRVKNYTSPTPIFSHFDIESAIATTMKPKVNLPSGGSIVIEQLEALVAIDVNSSRSKTGENIEQTAYLTNLEAAKEISRQVRLRDLGGLVVVDFIDMSSKKNRANVEKALRTEFEDDKAKTEFGKISKFGLLEMSRQRLRGSLASQSYAACPHCRGQGRVRVPELVALEILRKLQTDAIRRKKEGVSIVLKTSVTIALHLLNCKRREISEIESLHEIEIKVIPDETILEGEYKVETVVDKPAPTGLSSNSSNSNSGSINNPPKRDVRRRRRVKKRVDPKNERGDQRNDRRSSSVAI